MASLIRQGHNIESDAASDDPKEVTCAVCRRLMSPDAGKRIRIETIDDLETAAREHARSDASGSEDEYEALMLAAAHLCERWASNPVIALICEILANEPAEIAAHWAPRIEYLAREGTDSARICRAVAMVLRAWLDKPAPPESAPGLEEVRRVMQAGVRRCPLDCKSPVPHSHHRDGLGCGVPNCKVGGPHSHYEAPPRPEETWVIRERR